jgi:hypothetical protein
MNTGLGFNPVIGSPGTGEAISGAPVGPLTTRPVGAVGGGPPTCDDAASALCGPKDVSKVEQTQTKNARRRSELFTGSHP